MKIRMNLKKKSCLILLPSLQLTKTELQIVIVAAAQDHHGKEVQAEIITKDSIAKEVNLRIRNPKEVVLDLDPETELVAEEAQEIDEIVQETEVIAIDQGTAIVKGNVVNVSKNVKRNGSVNENVENANAKKGRKRGKNKNVKKKNVVNENDVIVNDVNGNVVSVIVKKNSCVVESVKPQKNVDGKQLKLQVQKKMNEKIVEEGDLRPQILKIVQFLSVKVVKADLVEM